MFDVQMGENRPPTPPPIKAQGRRERSKLLGKETNYKGSSMEVMRMYFSLALECQRPIACIWLDVHPEAAACVAAPMRKLWGVIWKRERLANQGAIWRAQKTWEWERRSAMRLVLPGKCVAWQEILCNKEVTTKERTSCINKDM